jgi:NAD(P)-dependent dehydrogenase (short-subunit alcohol dehydrogenase family)
MNNKPGRLAGKVALITGAANGMGACEAKLFAAEGAKVIVTDVNYDGAVAVVESIRSAGGEAIAIKHDVASEADWQQAISKAVATFNKVDILVNNAGYHPESVMKDITLTEWNNVISVNLTGAFLGMQAVIPEMIKIGGGSIVNISSIAATKPTFAHYSASKGGICSLTKVAAKDYAANRIRVNSVLPGLIKTDLTKNARNNPEINAMLASVTPWPEFGEVEDVAYAVLFLASDEARFVTGSELTVDGGVTGS